MDYGLKLTELSKKLYALDKEARKFHLGTENNENNFEKYCAIVDETSKTLSLFQLYSTCYTYKVSKEVVIPCCNCIQLAKQLGDAFYNAYKHPDQKNQKEMYSLKNNLEDSIHALTPVQKTITFNEMRGEKKVLRDVVDSLSDEVFITATTFRIKAYDFAQEHLKTSMHLDEGKNAGAEGPGKNDGEGK